MPGVVALDMLAERLLENINDGYISGFPQVKFHAPIYPDQKVTVQFHKKKEFLYDFTCKVNDQKVISGKILTASDRCGDG
ncbi:MAG: hypothetical protein U5J94_11815 [Thiohalophilus sp.]|nr:hypothetical protein [Thiohalophilus sp.]